MVGEWDRQTLRTSAQVAGLILEIERTRLQLARTLQTGMLRRERRRRGTAHRVDAGDGRRCAASSSASRARISRCSSKARAASARSWWRGRSTTLSPPRHGPFVAVNCAALVETLVEAELFGIEDRTATGVRGRRGKFEHADGGTLFLDEVSDLSLAAQAKLLRAIQDLAVERVGGTRRPARQRPHRRGHQPQPRRTGRAAAVPTGSLLPAERRRRPRAAAARAPRRHPRARALLPRAAPERRGR